MIVSGIILSVALAVSPSAPPNAAGTPCIRSARFTSPKLSVSRERTGATAYVRGPVRVTMNFEGSRARKPLLRIACLCLVDGALVVYSDLWDRPATNASMSRDVPRNAFKSCGYEPPPAQRDSAFTDPACVTKCLPEVSRETFASVVYGTAKMNDGFFRISASLTPKLLLYRLEMWQAGVLIGSFESSRVGLSPYDIPDDWHVFKRHPDKYTYRTR